MKRRDFLKFGATGLTVVAIGSLADWPRFWNGSRVYAAAIAGRGEVELDMVEVDAEMVDEETVPMWAFKLANDGNGDEHDEDDPALQPRIPGPVLVALTGDRLRLRVTNSINQGGDHGFEIPGVLEPVIIERRESVDLEFTAPAPGTYFYLDPENAPVNRVMGLHGVLVVLPRPVAGNGTPYDSPTAGVQMLFDDLGRTVHFPGHPWDLERNAIWVFNAIDPDKCDQADSSFPVSPAAFQQNFQPQYFTINGKSGFFAAQHRSSGGGAPHHDPNPFSTSLPTFDPQANVSLHGRVGQPILIRSLNAGLAWHSPHIHGNHVYQLTDPDGTVRDNLLFLDTWAMPPLARVDVLLPFLRPPDIPAAAWPPVQELFPLLYPMHDHNEISNTAAGGNYPHGLATHWQIDGDIDPREVVIFVEQADLRVRTGLVELEGRISRTPAEVGEEVTLHMHAGGPAGDKIGRTVIVGADGRWSFRGRALKAMASRQVTVMYHGPEDDAPVYASRTVPLRLR